jgi:hypothetical protein
MTNDQDDRKPLAEFCCETVNETDGSWSAVSARLAERLKGLPPDERVRIDRDTGRILTFQAPSRPINVH